MDLNEAVERLAQSVGLLPPLTAVSKLATDALQVKLKWLEGRACSALRGPGPPNEIDAWVGDPATLRDIDLVAAYHSRVPFAQMWRVERLREADAYRY